MLNLNPFLNAAEGATGGGAPAGGAQGGMPSGQQGGGQPAAQVYSLSDDSRIKVGDKEYTWKDYQAERANEVNTAKTATRAEIESNLRKLAQTIKQQQQQHQNPNGQQPQVDPLAQYEGQAIIAGKDMAAALRGTLGPVAQAIAQLQQQNQQLNQQVKKLGGGLGTLAKERNSAERSTRLESAIKGLGQIEGLDPKNAVLNEFVADILDAWEFDKPEEYPAMVQKRFSELRKLFRDLDKAELAAAKKRPFAQRVGGNASPSGPAKIDPRKWPEQAANILFGESQRT